MGSGQQVQQSSRLSVVATTLDDGSHVDGEVAVARQVGGPVQHDGLAGKPKLSIERVPMWTMSG